MALLNKKKKFKKLKRPPKKAKKEDKTSEEELFGYKSEYFVLHLIFDIYFFSFFNKLIFIQFIFY